MSDDRLLGLAPRQDGLLRLGASPLDDPVIAGLPRLREQMLAFKPVRGANRNFGGVAPDPVQQVRDALAYREPGWYYGSVLPFRARGQEKELAIPGILRDAGVGLLDLLQGRTEQAPDGTTILSPYATLTLLGLAGAGTTPAGALASGGRSAGIGAAGLSGARTEAEWLRAMSEAPMMYHGTDRSITAFEPGSFFSREHKHASGFARGRAMERGGDPAAGAVVYDVKLAPERPFSVNGTYSLAELDAILAAVEKDPDLVSANAATTAADNIAQGILGHSAAEVHRAVAGGQNPTGIPGGPLYHLLERHAGSAFNSLRAAGYDAISSGRDVQMLTNRNIRSTRARFDPKLRHTPDILAGLAGPAAAAAIG